MSKPGRLFGMRADRSAVWLSVLSIGVAVGLLQAASTIAGSVLGMPFGEETRARGVAIFARHVATDRDRELTAFALFQQWQARTAGVEHLSGYQLSTAHLRGEPAPLTIRVAEVTPAFFEALDATPTVGRGFGADVDTRGECVISDTLWRTRFGGDATVLGIRAQLDRFSGVQLAVTCTIVGVAPATLRYPERADVWLPFAPSDFLRTTFSGQWFGVVGRLRETVTIAQATTEMTAIMQAVQAEHRGAQPTHTANVIAVRELLVARYRALVLGLAVAAGVLLLVVIASTGGLLAARAVQEQRHDRIRLSLGASPARLIADAARGGVIRGCAAFLVAIPASLVCLRALDRLSVALFERPLPARIGALDAAFGCLCAVVVSSGLAMFVQWHALRRARRAGPWLGRAGVDGGRTATRLRAVLTVGEIALSVLLLVAAGDLLSRVAAVRAVDLGFATERLLTMRLALPPARYDTSRATQFYDALMARLRALPAVAGVALSSDDPLLGVSANPEFTLQYENRTLAPDERVPVLLNGVTANYMDVLGLPLLSGAAPAHTGAGEPAAAINETFARRLFADDTPIGKRFRLGGRNQPWWTITGVVADARNDGPLAPPRPTAYLPYPAFGKSDMTVLVKTREPGDVIADDLRAIVTSLDRDLPIARIVTATDLVDARFAGLRIGALVMSVLAAAALLLTTLGLYGVLAALSMDLRPEIGLRLALGATPYAVVALVAGRAVTLVSAGLLLGATCVAAVAVGLRATVAIDIHAPMPTHLVALLATVAVASIAATIRPAWQALRVNPIDALRAE